MNKDGATEAAPPHGGEGWEGRRRGGRMRRGDIRTAVLAILAEEPGHGYDVIQRLEEKTAGAWRPSPGSVYPTLQLLEDEGLVRSVERDGKRVYEITDAGREEATPTDRGGRRHAVGDRRSQRRPACGELPRCGAPAPRRVEAGRRLRQPRQVERMIEILKRARKEIYTMLAED